MLRFVRAYSDRMRRQYTRFELHSPKSQKRTPSRVVLIPLAVPNWGFINDDGDDRAPRATYEAGTIYSGHHHDETRIPYAIPVSVVASTPQAAARNRRLEI